MMTKEFQPNDRFLTLYVYRDGLGDCTNGGASANAKTIYIPHPEGPDKYSDIQGRGETNLIFIPEQRGAEYHALKPAVLPENHEKMVGPMCGGNLAYTSDSRCRRVYHIHDRYETQECYNANFN